MSKHTIEIPNPLISDISAGRASLFLGAGASLEADFPSSIDLAQALVELAGSPHTDFLKNQPLDFVAQYLYLERGFGESWVREKLIEIFSKATKNVKRPPSAAHALLTEFHWRSVFTTNYDRLVEIAYESHQGAIQRSLPFYVPDPQLLRHSPSISRIVKLNGSIDEAERNVKHKLILTFAEQQNAKQSNKGFYELLKQESVNGPIIFVGFRFNHPGSVNGASPEFTILQSILQDMGTAGRTHYCVSPYDIESPAAQLSVRILQSARIECINSKFGEFMSTLSQRVLDRPESIDERASISIPYGSAKYLISADDYEKDRRHFDILGSHIEFTPPPSVSESLNGLANWASFVNGHCVERSVKQKFLDLLNNTANENAEIIVVVAPAGWGKTFFLKDIAVQLYWSLRPVIWLNEFGTVEISQPHQKQIRRSSWDVVRLDALLGSLSDTVGETNENLDPVIIIVDNCFERMAEVLSLFRTLSRNGRKFKMVVTLRESEYEYVVSNYPPIRKAHLFSAHESSNIRKDVTELIEFCSLNRIATFSDSSQKELVAARILTAGADGAIILALQVIFDKQHRPFSEIVQSMWDGLQTPLNKAIVLSTASLHRFGSSFTPRLYAIYESVALEFPGEDVFGAIQQCTRGPLLSEIIVEDEPCLQTMHSLVAEEVIRVSGVTPAAVDDALLRLVGAMSNHSIDLEQMRRLVKRINDYSTNLATDELTVKLFEEASLVSADDWVICQQFAKYLLKRRDYERSLFWADRAIDSNPDHPPLRHTKGNVLQKWGMHILSEKNENEADEKFEAARECFSISRVRGEPDEYGYVTHLDMLLGLIDSGCSEEKRINLIAEGAGLYRDGLRTVPHDKFNVLLESRFRKAFDLKGSELDSLIENIRTSISTGTSSPYAAGFAADQLITKGNAKAALQILEDQRGLMKHLDYLYLKEAEIHARLGRYSNAAIAIDSSKRVDGQVIGGEVSWSRAYWDLLISVALREFKEARIASQELSTASLFSRSYPRGYFWKSSARDVPKTSRKLSEHAYIWNGRVKDVKPEGSYGQIEINSVSGDSFHVAFNPRYFRRGDMRRGDSVKFVMTISSTGLRADDIETKPFINTVDDLYLG